jgi:hypothetical protein
MKRSRVLEALGQGLINMANLCALATAEEQEDDNA